MEEDSFIEKFNYNYGITHNIGEKYYLFCMSFFSSGIKVDHLLLKHVFLKSIFGITDEFYKDIYVMRSNVYFHNNLIQIDNFSYIEKEIFSLREYNNTVYIYVKDEMLAIKLYVTMKYNKDLLMIIKNNFGVTLHIMYIVKDNRVYINNEDCLYKHNDIMCEYKNQGIDVNFYLVNLMKVLYYFLKKYANLVVLVY